MNLGKEINLNKKFIIIMVLLNIITIGMYYSYALFEVNVVKNNVVVLRTLSIDVVTTITGEGASNNSFTIASGETKTVTVNLTTTQTDEIGYKMYYTTEGTPNLEIRSNAMFDNNILAGTMTSAKTFTLTIKNNGESSITLTLGTIGGLKQYPINLESGKNEIEVLPPPANEVVLAKATERANDGSNCKTIDTSDNDGITYISGTKDCIDFNYLWYSGKMWRVTAVYPDGAMKLVTDNNITSIGFNPYEQVNFYTDANTKSYMYQWLNEDFYDTLENADNIIDTTKYWNATQTDNASTKPNEVDENNQLLSTMIPTSISKVGLLNSYEYYKSYQVTEYYQDSYLNIRYYWWLLNPASSTTIHRVNNIGNDNASSNPPDAFGVRPSIIIKSDIVLSGKGSINNPYKITIDKTVGENQDLINTRISGEYVKIKYNNTIYDEIYRIVNTEKDPNNNANNITKLVSLDYVKENNSNVSLQFATDNTSGSGTVFGSQTTIDNNNKSTWYSYLNGTFTNNENNQNGWFHNLPYNSLLTEGLYYIRGLTKYGSYNYKASVCDNENTTDRIAKCISDGNTVQTETFDAGLLRHGEMFATQEGDALGFESSSNIWLISRHSNSTVSCIHNGGNGRNFSPTESYAARPTIYLKSTVKILECPIGNICDGTKQHPYIVG